MTNGAKDLLFAFSFANDPIDILVTVAVIEFSVEPSVAMAFGELFDILSVGIRTGFPLFSCAGFACCLVECLRLADALFSLGKMQLPLSECSGFEKRFENTRTLE
jgi:hypothetical protein